MKYIPKLRPKAKPKLSAQAFDEPQPKPNSAADNYDCLAAGAGLEGKKYAKPVLPETEAGFLPSTGSNC